MDRDRLVVVTFAAWGLGLVGCTALVLTGAPVWIFYLLVVALSWIGTAQVLRPGWGLPLRPRRRDDTV